MFAEKIVDGVKLDQYLKIEEHLAASGNIWANKHAFLFGQSDVYEG